MTEPSRGVSVELFESESVVPGGRRRIRWFVREAHGWVAVARHASARTELQAPAPGTVWESRVELTLAPGTLVARVERLPQPGRRRDPLAYLEREARDPAERRVEHRYRVGVRGQLQPV